MKYINRTFTDLKFKKSKKVTIPTEKEYKELHKEWLEKLEQYKDFI